jgi:hypothetical protein
MPVSSSPPERVSVMAVARELLVRPWKIFLFNWNWKAGLLGGVFRALFFSVAVLPRDMAGLRGVAIQLAFRVAIGGLWGALAQAFCCAEPAWIAGVLIALIVPAGVHGVEYTLLRAGHASHIRTGMIISVALSVISLLLNWGLMRRGLMLTGKGTDSLATDFRRLPAALADLALAGPRTVMRVVRGTLA